MTNVITLAKHGAGFTPRMAIEKANRMTSENLANGINRHVVLMPNKSSTADVTQGFEGRLVLTDEWKREQPAYPALSGTFFVFGERGSRLPRILECCGRDPGERWVFDTHGAAGASGVVLAINHGFKQDGTPLIKLHDDRGKIVVEITDPSRIRVLEDFPTVTGWYLADNEFGIPGGKPASPFGRHFQSENQGARCLLRGDGPQAGLVVRGINIFGDGRDVYLNGGSSNRIGALALEREVGVAEAQWK